MLGIESPRFVSDDVIFCEETRVRSQNYESKNESDWFFQNWKTIEFAESRS